MISKVKKTDRRVRKTEAQLKHGLVTLMQRKSIREITVKELVEEVDINRSTFYLHYSDIFQMLDCIEEDLANDFKNVLKTIPKDCVTNMDKAHHFLMNLFILFENNRELCRALLGPNGDPSFCDKILKLISETVQFHIAKLFPVESRDAYHIHTYALNGCFGLIKEWLNSPVESHDAPEHMAELAFSMLLATFNATNEKSK
ncbi:MAG: TetR family transcriptional regulator C-terminal domain-containing protein [Lachnospiraceae bacterium]|nr:TetR family transcriptional regulator C-terminal domain-containing protein [Lachnospiraceae bacterium]